MKKLFAVFVLLHYCFLLWSFDCVMYPVECYVEDSECIILGEVKELAVYNKVYEAIVQVDEIIKGDMKVNNLIRFTEAEPLQSLNFEIGEKYVLFGFSDENESYQVYPCSWSGSIQGSKKVIRKSRKAVKKLNRGKKICYKEYGFFKKLLVKIFGF